MFEKNSYKRMLMLMMSGTLMLAGCGTTTAVSAQSSSTETTTETTSANTETNTTESLVTSITLNSTGILDTSSMFSERDLTQTPDLSDAVICTLTDGEDVHLSQEGTYILQGSANNATVYVEAGDTAKVQLVLDGISIANEDRPCIYVVSGDKVFVTTISDSTLTVSGTYATDSENADAAIFSCEDLVLNGTATLTINSTDVGVDTKDDLKVTGGTYVITADTKAFEANDSIRIADGTFTLNAGTDGLHAENSKDDSKGYIYIAGGTFDIQAGDDGIHATTVMQIDGGSLTINAVEALEATYVQINGGTLDLSASDDGINAGQKSNAYDVTIEITGGDINITMAQGDTDAIDANGNLIVSGGNINIDAQFAFDFDGTVTFTGGTVTVNGEEVTEITNSMQFGFGGMMPGNMNFGTPPGDWDGETPPEGFDGTTPPNGFTMPDGENLPEGFDGTTPPNGFTKPDGENPPEGFDGENPPEGFGTGTPPNGGGKPGNKGN